MSKYYAAVDKDSVVNNVVVEDETTYEDDTRTAPNVGLVIANAELPQVLCLKTMQMKTY